MRWSDEAGVAGVGVGGDVAEGIIGVGGVGVVVGVGGGGGGLVVEDVEGVLKVLLEVVEPEV